jgi:hypothetical protein
MSERRRVTRADLEAKLRQIQYSLQDLLRRVQQLATKALAPAGSLLLFLAYRRSRRRKRRTLIEIRRA